MVFIPDQSIPVEEEHQSSPQQSSQVLSQDVVRSSPPADPAHHGQSQGDSRVEVTTRHSSTDQDTQEHPDTPTNVDREEGALGVERQDWLSSGAITNDHENHGAWDRVACEYIPTVNRVKRDQMFT